jgi:hypothetical protein
MKAGECMIATWSRPTPRRVGLSLAACFLVGLGPECPAQSKPATQPATVTIVGIVKASPAKAEEAATVVADKVVYKIVKDAKGAIVARDAAGKKAEIRGSVQDVNGNKWITVSWCALVE